MACERKKGGESMARKFFCELPEGGFLLLEENNPIRRFYDRLQKTVCPLKPAGPDCPRSCPECGVVLVERIADWEWWMGDNHPVFVTRYEECACGTVSFHDGLSGIVTEPHLDENEIAEVAEGLLPVEGFVHLHACRSCMDKIVFLTKTILMTPPEVLPPHRD